jgi:hypothetical protein
VENVWPKNNYLWNVCHKNKICGYFGPIKIKARFDALFFDLKIIIAEI